MGEGWREGESGLVPTSHSPGGRGQREELTQGPQLTALVLHPTSQFSLLGNGGFWDCQRRVCSLNLRPALLNFPLSLPFLPATIPSESPLCWSWKRQTSDLGLELTDFIDR